MFKPRLILGLSSNIQLGNANVNASHHLDHLRVAKADLHTTKGLRAVGI